jgi:hypothetical protein
MVVRHRTDADVRRCGREGYEREIVFLCEQKRQQKNCSRSMADG